MSRGGVSPKSKGQNPKLFTRCNNRLLSPGGDCGPPKRFRHVSSCLRLVCRTKSPVFALLRAELTCALKRAIIRGGNRAIQCSPSEPLPAIVGNASTRAVGRKGRKCKWLSGRRWQYRVEPAAACPSVGLLLYFAPLVPSAPRHLSLTSSSACAPPSTASRSTLLRSGAACEQWTGERAPDVVEKGPVERDRSPRAGTLKEET